MDDHLTQVMLLDKTRRHLDYHFMLWKFDSSKLDHVALSKLDKGSQAAEEIEYIETIKKPCCILF